MPYIMDMSALKITSKGQVTLNRDFLKHMGVHPGQEVRVVKMPNGRLELAPKGEADFRSLRGLLHDLDRKPATLEQIDDAIAAGWAGEVALD